MVAPLSRRSVVFDLSASAPVRYSPAGSSSSQPSSAQQRSSALWMAAVSLVLPSPAAPNSRTLSVSFTRDWVDACAVGTVERKNRRIEASAVGSLGFISDLSVSMQRGRLLTSEIILDRIVRPA